MKKLLRQSTIVILLAILCGALGSTATAQDAGAMFIPDWKEYSYKEHLMAFSLPAPPNYRTQDADSAFGKATTYAYSAPAGNGAVFMISVTEYPDKIQPADLAKLMTNACNDVADHLKAKTISNKTIALENNPGVDAEFLSDKWHVRYRAFAVGTRMYQLIYMGSASLSLSPDTGKFMDSFHLLKQ